MTVTVGAVASVAADAGALWQPLIAVAPPVDVGFDRPRQAAVTLVTFAVTAVLVAGAAALTYRWYFRDEIPEGVTVLLGVAVVALYLNTTSLGAIAVGESPALLEPQSVFFNVVSLGVAAVTAPPGRYVGDRLAVDVFALSGARQLEGELSGIVRAVGRSRPSRSRQPRRSRTWTPTIRCRPRRRPRWPGRRCCSRGSSPARSSASGSSHG
jgi:hypothetical protein